MSNRLDKIKDKLSGAADFVQAHRRIFSEKMGDDRFIYMNKKKLQKDDPSNVSGLRFHDKGLTDESVPVICEIIENAPNLQEISLEMNKFSAKGIEKILDSLQNHQYFEKLNISSNPLGNEIATVLARFLNASESIKTLSAASTGMGDGAMAEVLGAAGESASIHELLLANNAPKKATSAATLALVKKNPNITSLSLTSGDWRKTDDFADAYSNISHRNLLVLSPATDKLRELTDRNEQAAKQVVETLSGNMDGLDFPQLAFVSNRRPSAYRVLERKNDEGASVNQAKRNFDSLLAKMPAMPEKGSDLKALFQVNTQGYSALDNPVLWEHPDAEERLAGFVIKREDLTRKTEKGASLLESLAHGMPTKKTIAFLNRQDIKLGARELLDSEGAPNAVYKAFIERNDIAPLFSLANWVGKTQGELRATMEPLTSFQQKQVPFHSLTQEMRRFGSNQNMGR